MLFFDRLADARCQRLLLEFRFRSGIELFQFFDLFGVIGVFEICKIEEKGKLACIGCEGGQVPEVFMT